MNGTGKESTAFLARECTHSICYPSIYGEIFDIGNRETEIRILGLRKWLIRKINPGFS
jgi:hypothetical protein